jgi:hypothetical protein
MDISFHCEKCAQHIVIDGAGEGMTVPCPACNTNLTVPLAEVAECSQVDADGKTWTLPASLIRLPYIGEEVEFKIEKSGASRFLEAEKLDFFGPCVCSSNRRFILAWHESGIHPFTGKQSLGLYFLLDGHKTIAIGKMQRPNDGKVCNNGNFILNDYMFRSSEILTGKFYAFSPNGEILITSEFNANLGDNGILDDGRFAFCHTCTSKYKEHSQKTFVFDLENKALLTTVEGNAGKVKLQNLIKRLAT